MLDSDTLASRGFVVAPGLIDPAECRALAALWPEKPRFRSHVVMQRHGFGQGEYQYFAYPLPERDRGAAPGALPGARRRGQPLERRARRRQALPDEPAGLAAPVPRRRPEAADAAAAALRTGRLQLPAPRPLRRAGVPAAGDGAAERSGQGLQRRRVHAGRAAAAHAVARRGRATEAGRRRDLRRQRTAGEGNAAASIARPCAMACRACARASASPSASSSTTRRRLSAPAPGS